jgi:hypothetical protein
VQIEEGEIYIFIYKPKIIFNACLTKPYKMRGKEVEPLSFPNTHFL